MCVCVCVCVRVRVRVRVRACVCVSIYFAYRVFIPILAFAARFSFGNQTSVFIAMYVL